MNADTLRVFETERMAMWWETSSSDHPLRLLALEYHQSCEDYDWAVCTHHEGKFAQPVNPEQRALIAEHAKHEYMRLNRIVMERRLGGPDVLYKAIQAATPAFEARYVPPHLRKPLDMSTQPGQSQPS